MAYRYFFVSISNLELISLSDSGNDQQHDASSVLQKSGSKYLLYIDFDGYKTDMMTPQVFPCSWRGENMSCIYNTAEVGSLHEKTLLIECREHRSLWSDREVGRVEIDLHTLMTGPRDIDISLMTKPIETSFDEDSDDSDDSDDDDSPLRRKRNKTAAATQPQRICRVRFHINIEQLCADIQFGIDRLDITAVCNRLRMIRSDRMRPATLRIAYGYKDTQVVRWNDAPQRLSFDKILQRIDGSDSAIVHASSALVFLAQQIKVWDFVYSQVHIIFTVETQQGDEYEAGRLVLPILGLYDYFQPRITFTSRVLWTDVLLDDLSQFQMVIHDNCHGMFSIVNGPMVAQMPRGRLTDQGIVGAYLLGFPMPDSKQVDPRTMLKSTYRIDNVMRVMWSTYLRDMYGQEPKWIFRTQPNPKLFERGHLLPEDESHHSENTVEDGDLMAQHATSFATTTMQNPLLRDDVPTHLTVETYLQQLVRFFHHLRREWRKRDVQLRQEYAAEPTHARARLIRITRREHDMQLDWASRQARILFLSLAASTRV